MLSKATSEHAGEADKNGKYKVLTRVKVLKPMEACTFSYFTIGKFPSSEQANNLYKYIYTSFFRFLLLQKISSINLSKDKFSFIPLQDFTEHSDIDWSKSIAEIDQQLYRKYDLSPEEIAFIEKMIKPME